MIESLTKYNEEQIPYNALLDYLRKVSKAQVIHDKNEPKERLIEKKWHDLDQEIKDTLKDYREKGWISIGFMRPVILLIIFWGRSPRLSLHFAEKEKEPLIFNSIYWLNKIKLLEPCAGELACTVLRGGKSARIYLSQSSINRRFR